MNKGGANTRSALSSYTYTERFYEVFPYYLSLGMTYDQFWNETSELVRYYLKAEKLRSERKNQEMWLQGMYVYEALCDVSPILHAFAKKGTKPAPYSTEPYPINKEQTEQRQERREKEKKEKAMRTMEAYMAAFNSKKVGDKIEHDT